MADPLAVVVAGTDLQAVQPEEVDARARGARDGVDRRQRVHGHAADAIPPLRWMGISAASVHGFTIVHVRATFQATVLPVLTLIAEPKTDAPAFAARRI